MSKFIEVQCLCLGLLSRVFEYSTIAWLSMCVVPPTFTIVFVISSIIWGILPLTCNWKQFMYVWALVRDPMKKS